MSDYVMEAHGLTRYYGARRVVYDLDLLVPRGCVYGFLGRNGAGKSTTIRMLLGFVAPTRGSGSILGYDSANLPPEARARIGYLTEGHPVYGWMTIEECRRFQRSFYKHWNDDLFDAVIDHFGLSPKAKAGGLSRGERAGLCLAMTLAPEPELLVLDDPALGLDPVARRTLLQFMVYVTRRAGQTVFFSSHLLSDVERVADRIAILDHGVLRAECSVETFRERVREFVLRFDGPVPAAPKDIPGLLQVLRAEGEMQVTIANYNESAAVALHALGPTAIEETPLSLEDAFISYLGDRGEKSFLVGQAEQGG